MDDLNKRTQETQTTLENDMVEGYLDGLDETSPCPSENRSKSYHHGFLNGRDDLAEKPRAHASVLRYQAKHAEIEDDNV